MLRFAGAKTPVNFSNFPFNSVFSAHSKAMHNLLELEYDQTLTDVFQTEYTTNSAGI